jgi:hypothetical protein
MAGSVAQLTQQVGAFNKLSMPPAGVGLAVPTTQTMPARGLLPPIAKVDPRRPGLGQNVARRDEDCYGRPGKSRRHATA